MLEAIASGLEAIAIGVEAIVIMWHCWFVWRTRCGSNELTHLIYIMAHPSYQDVPTDMVTENLELQTLV